MARRSLLAIVLLAAMSSTCGLPAGRGAHKLDPPLRALAGASRGLSRVIIQTIDGSPADALILAHGGRPGRRLPLLHGQVAVIPDSELNAVAAYPTIASIGLDRPVRGAMDPTAGTIGATWARENFGVDGTGVGVAVIDSGVASWHDDLSDRVVHFVDFVDSQPSPYDDYGHGTHVAGIIAGSGQDSSGARRGIAPGATLIVLKVLNGSGLGFISDVIAALGYAVEHRAEFNIRIINLSVAAGVHESYDVDPLTLAAKRAVDAGIVVVTAAGNFGQDAKGEPQNGGITAPGNAPWVLTVGATTHNGTAGRGDDSVAPFSSRGPTYIDHAAKPDIVAPGVGIESATDSSTLLFATHAPARLWGTISTPMQPYLSLTGTSMSAPVVAGTVALMLQANPSITPNLAKAILEYTAERRAKYSDLAQGAGFLNARGAVQLAKLLGSDTWQAPKDPIPWSRHINWGNHRVGGGVLKASANAWRTDVTWGAATTRDGARVVWGALCTDTGCDAAAWGASIEEPDNNWGTACDAGECSPIVPAAGVNVTWDTAGPRPVVWSTTCATLALACDDLTWKPRERGQRPAGSASVRLGITDR